MRLLAAQSRGQLAARTRARGALPPFLLPISATFFLLFGAGHNAALALFAILVLLWGAAATWRRGETPILFYVFFFQWLQASIAIFYANFRDVPLDSFLYSMSQSVELATALSLIGLAFLASGIRIGLRGTRAAARSDELRRATTIFTYEKWIWIYAAGWIVATAAQLGARMVPGLSQGLLALAYLKWAAFVSFTIVSFMHPKRRPLVWVLVFLFEFALSIGGFFSSFRDVFLYSAIAIAAAGARMTAGRVLAGSLLLAGVLALGVVWTAVKGDYRVFASGGNLDQTVKIDRWTAVAKLAELVAKVDADRLMDATSAMIKRISYVEFFGATLEHVPSVVAHENGSLWLDALTRPLMPRILFPDKAIADDSATTGKYSGVEVAGFDQGTSISIGYMGESYVDFGMYFMFVPIFILGIVLGRIYIWLLYQRRVGPLVGMSLASSVLMSVSKLETTAVKTVGGLAVSVIVCWLLVQFVLPMLFRHAETAR